MNKNNMCDFVLFCFFAVAYYLFSSCDIGESVKEVLLLFNFWAVNPLRYFSF